MQSKKFFQGIGDKAKEGWAALKGKTDEQKLKFFKDRLTKKQEELSKLKSAPVSEATKSQISKLEAKIGKINTKISKIEERIRTGKSGTHSADQAKAIQDKLAKKKEKLRKNEEELQKLKSQPSGITNKLKNKLLNGQNERLKKKIGKLEKSAQASAASAQPQQQT